MFALKNEGRYPHPLLNTPSRKLSWNGSDPQRNKSLMMEIVQCNANSKFLQFFPQFKELYQEVNQEFEGYAHETDEANQKLQTLPKEKALEQIKNECLSISPLLYQVYNRKCSSVDYLRSLNFSQFQAILNKLRNPDKIK